MSTNLTSTLTSKNQFTLPTFVRKRAGLKRGDKFLVSVIDADSFQARLLHTKKAADP